MKRLSERQLAEQLQRAAVSAALYKTRRPGIDAEPKLGVLDRNKRNRVAPAPYRAALSE